MKNKIDFQGKTAEIISSGKELLLGQTTNTNASFLGSELAKLGLKVTSQLVVDDDFEQLSQAIALANDRSDLVITTGGLGPTDDDLTREAIAGVLKENLQIDVDLLTDIEALFATRGQKMPKINEKQAWLIPSAQSIKNSYGSAPGWLVQKSKKLIIALPGPPTELKSMWKLAKEMINWSSNTNIERIYHTTGIGESQIVEILEPLFRSNNPLITTYAKRDGIDIRVEAISDDINKSKHLVEPFEKEVKEKLGDFIYSDDQTTLLEQVIRRLTEKKQTLCTIESLTGGLLAEQITSIAGASNVFSGGIVSYTNEFKEYFGVDRNIIQDFGVVSAETALAMAEAIHKKLNPTWALSTTGVAGPDELEGKPVGTAFIGLKGPNVNETKRIKALGDRQMIRERVISAALFMLWSHIRY